MSDLQGAENGKGLRRALPRLAAVILDAQPWEDVLAQVAELAVLAVSPADGAGLTVGRSLPPEFLVGSNELVRTVDAVQYRLGEGPCVQAAATLHLQVCGSLGGETRWPRFGPRAGRLGVHSALSVPLIIEERCLGVVNLYSRHRSAFAEGWTEVAERFARAAAVTVANARALEHSRRQVEQLQQALLSRPVIDQAIGILMSRRGCTAGEALDILRRTSRSERTRLATVAEQLVEQAVARARRRSPS